ncbi:2Fe-2S iron-sulfur cluster-binding protein [Anaerosalibacter massiliensis]|uniref:2Fe-2S iron-sulfur cluster-binding protein n=1 Tax=Anaerosalibacter massiliensis TaxID=1347392 RepID=A0A9X2MLX3_9FIRM|nr:2Fe-2S iron-sulfur cluster-binding protein [Anaerosalibacter massiliensis]MCR2043581.1 2Fe-2S iron-sulfur cluster-binding protein [Anaerosalibacter massiliensis]
MANVNIIINGQKVEVPKDYNIIQAAEILGIDIPALCYDSNLEVAGACRLCLVEVERSEKLQTACSTKVKDGMVIYTESEKVVRIRKQILQLLLDSHPNDCLTCEKAGECLLQEYAYRYGVKFKEHNGVKRPKYIDNSSPYILKDDSKCILCGKCVRTCNDIDERRVLSFSNRGYDTRIISDTDQTLETSKCVSCNRCVAVCPVGALIDRRQINKDRVWNLNSRTINCKSCDYGCEFEVLSQNKKNIAVKAKHPTNGRPLCLRGRLITELMYLDNPDKPYRKVDGKFIESSWTKALGLGKIMEKIEKVEKDNA